MRLPIVPLGDRAILIKFGDRIAPEINDQIIALFERLTNLAGNELQFCVPAFCSLGIGFDPAVICYADLCSLFNSSSTRFNQLKLSTAVRCESQFATPLPLALIWIMSLLQRA